MAEIFLERFAVKRIEKIFVREWGLSLIGVNSMITGKRLSKCTGSKGLLYPSQRHMLDGCLQKQPETHAFDFN